MDIVFIGTDFLHDKYFKEYILKKAYEVSDEIHNISFFKDNDSSLLLYLQEKIEQTYQTLIVTTKNNAITISKILCTITEDNLELKDNFLIPSKVEVFEKNSYLLEYKDNFINLIEVTQNTKLPKIFLKEKNNKAIIQLFGEDKESAKVLLESISKTHDVELHFLQIVPNWLEVHVEAKKYGNISKFIISLKQLMPKQVIDTQDIMPYIIERLSSKNKKITFAESCTGGLLSYFLTKNNGSSNIFDGSLITYSNHLKENWLAVNEQTLIDHGAVSFEVVREMSEGALDVSEADYAISISGIAGDGGGTKEKPVGTVFIGVRNKDNHIEKKFLFEGDRNYIQRQATLQAIKMLVELDKETFF